MDSASYILSSRFLQWEIYLGAKKVERGKTVALSKTVCAPGKGSTVMEREN